MKDEISDVDIQKALIEQLKGNDCTSEIKKKRKKKGNNQDSSKLKKRKTSEEKNNSDSVTDERNKATAKPQTNKSQNNSQRPLRPPPKVVVFEEPGRSKEKDNSQKINRISHELTNNDDDASDDDFLEIARDVREFGMTGFSKKERRKYEQQKAQALGAKAPKGLKMPYKIYMSHVRVQKRKEERRQQLERAMGMTTKKNNNNNKDENTRSSIGTSGWWTDKSSKGLDMSIGKYKKGVQTLSRDDIKRINSKKRK